MLELHGANRPVFSVLGFHTWHSILTDPSDLGSATLTSQSPLDLPVASPPHGEPYCGSFATRMARGTRERLERFGERGIDLMRCRQGRCASTRAVSRAAGRRSTHGNRWLSQVGRRASISARAASTRGSSRAAAAPPQPFDSVRNPRCCAKLSTKSLAMRKLTPVCSL